MRYNRRNGVLTKIRYKDKGAFNNLYTYENGVNVRFYEDVKGIAQARVRYFMKGEDVIGGGIIQRQPILKASDQRQLFSVDSSINKYCT